MAPGAQGSGSGLLGFAWSRIAPATIKRKALAPVYGWFTEGFDTQDLKDGKALLDELN